jgi:hypothetical protein
MNKLLIISNCAQCHNHYWNYMPDGKTGKLWCSRLNVKLQKNKYQITIPKECTLMDSDIFEQEPDYNDGTNGQDFTELI